MANKWIGCINGLAPGRAMWGFQPKTEFHIANNFIYWQNVTFELMDFTPDHSLSTTTNDAIGRYRTQEYVDSFADKMNFTFIDDVTHEFIKFFIEEHEASDENYMNMLNSGFKVFRVQNLGDSIKILEWDCVSITSAPKFGMQKGAGDAVQEMVVNFNKPPKKSQVGIEIALPCDIAEVTADVVATPSATSLSVAVTNIVDEDGLIADNEIVVTVIGKVEGCRDYAFYTSKTVSQVSDLVVGETFTFTGLPAGEYAYNVSHKLEAEAYRTFAFGSGKEVTA